MSKKILIALLVIVMSLFSTIAYADEDVTEEITEEEVVEDEIIEEENLGDAVLESPDDTVIDKQKPSDNGKDKDSKDADEKKDNGKSKVNKQELEKMKQQRTDAKIEAKVYIKEVKALFKDADTETKKEILSEISNLKKELKDNSIGVFVKGLDVDFEKYDNVKPVIKEERTLVPVRAITETFGADVKWDEATSTITIILGDTKIEMIVDNKTAQVNGTAVEMDVPPTVENGRTLVPIRFISEALNLQVDWDDNSQTVIIEEKN